MAASKKERLDQLLVKRGLAPSRERARALIMAGVVTVGGRVVDKAGALVAEDAPCEVRDSRGELRYASRGGLKLERALDAFGLSPEGLVCLDVGASTGGFTDALLQRGARQVYAVDVGQGQLALGVTQRCARSSNGAHEYSLSGAIARTAAVRRHRCLVYFAAPGAAARGGADDARRLDSRLGEAAV